MYWYTSTSGSAAAMFNLWLPVSSCSVRDRCTEKLDPVIAGVAVGISSLGGNTSEVTAVVM
jgi:hypothetical protein